MGSGINGMVLCNEGYKGVGESYIRNVIDRLSADPREAFSEIQGLSPRNLKYMCAFALAWQDREIVQEVLAQITWYHNLALLEKIAEQEVRLWYARKELEEGWSRSVLVMLIDNQLQECRCKATD
ncbi:MAG: hypothetical protein QG605_1808 [Euryarchaeota archaeon]|nr:hypothetical protein [Euryarchaeota archaeon]